MPFRLFHHSKKSKKDKTGADQVDQKTEEPPDSVRTQYKPHVYTQHLSDKASSGPGGHIHASGSPAQHKDNKVEKIKKAKTMSALIQKTKSMNHIHQLSNRDSGSSRSNENMVRSHLDLSVQPKRAMSYGTSMDGLNRDRRIMDIVQLDNYMEYLRHTEDGGNMTNRLCCAQFLKMGLLRFEQMRMNSLERIDKLSVAQTPSNRASPSILKQQRSKASDDKMAASQDADQKEDHSDDKKVGASHHVTFTCGESNSDGSKDSDPDSIFDSDSEGSSPAPDRKKLSLRVKQTKTPVWPSDIEIF